ncbi:MAG: hypothetical protein MRT15_10665 [archaeon YNP-LCB-003-016]|uniref:hypothetical protein n=1 Tax=Candidatus Culexarchaeum yellowstonense TaxID=2928963 RepID=UPI0026EE63D2|nr:hypothetical protein [Candidatus Culexarchaeum yellowstonense]MCR6692844.1 hypothetical protein [Candidatus Culexarchaeum yellowstonense]
MSEEEKYFGMSPLPLEEKKKIMDEEYYPKIHLYGIITSLIHALIIFLPVIYLAALGYFPPWDKAILAFINIASVVGPYWIIEPISYFGILGVVGTYISFLAGNISNMRLPVSAVAQEVAGVKEGSYEGEIVGGLAIIASQWMLTIISFLAAIIVTGVIALLPPAAVKAFDWLLPSIWGAIFAQFSLRNIKLAMIAFPLALVIVYLGVKAIIPAYLEIPIMVFGMAGIAIALYRKKILK